MAVEAAGTQAAQLRAMIMSGHGWGWVRDVLTARPECGRLASGPDSSAHPTEVRGTITMSAADSPSYPRVAAEWNTPPFELDVRNVFTEARELLLSKHQDYGARNIADAPGGPLNGLRVRMWDKMARLNHLLGADREPQFESLRDTLVDLANYALIGVLVGDGKWPSE